MSIESITNTELFKVVVSIVTGGAFVGWYREHRRAKKDAQQFALEFMREQSSRIDKLIAQVATLEAEKGVTSNAIEALREQNHQLISEIANLKHEIYQKDHEITRLKTALGEHERKAA